MGHRAIIPSARSRRARGAGDDFASAAVRVGRGGARQTRLGYSSVMPLYEYKCRTCDHTFERIVKLGETPPCPECGAAEPERLFSRSVSVSTDKTRKRSLSAARKKGR